MLRNLGCGVFNALLPPALLVLLLAIRLTSAQEITTMPDGRRVAVTIFDEIDDVRERRAFREVWDTSEPRLQRDLAVRFVERYPRSILLREAYELAARASVAADDLASGLDWAKRSLRLLPENPSLLVLAADTATRLRQLDLAETSARDALRALEHADRPSSMKPRKWTEIRDGLRVTAQVILGRAAATDGRYADAETALMAALALAPGDSEASQLLAVVRKARGAKESAASTRAREVESEASSSETKAERYAGSTACRDCHPWVYERWQATGMAKMFRAYRAENVIGDFSGRQTVSGSARAIMVGDKHFVEIRKGDSQDWVRYPVDYTIGSKWQQAYATKLPDNRLVVFPIQYSRLRSSWLNYWKIVDAPGSPRTDIARFHEIPEQAVYQQTCAPCHTSQLRLASGVGSRESGVRTSLEMRADATFREGGVNCEMCHGPSLGHVARMKAGTGPSTALRTAAVNAGTPIKFKNLSPTQSVAICAQCHAQSAVHDAEPSGAVNYSTDRTWYRTYPMHLMSSFPRDAFYRDGRFKATTFISEAFTRSQCFRKGGATCASCHDPHPPDAAQNPTSLKFSEASNQMCLQCHTDLHETGPLALSERSESNGRGALARHTRHAEGSEASRCVSCHMPRITEALLFKARSHQIDDIPDVAMTERFGNDESPNACLSCHQDRDAAWLRRVSAQRALDPGGDPWRR